VWAYQHSGCSHTGNGYSGERGLEPFLTFQIVAIPFHTLVSLVPMLISSECTLERACMGTTLYTCHQWLCTMHFSPYQRTCFLHLWSEDSFHLLIIKLHMPSPIVRPSKCACKLGSTGFNCCMDQPSPTLITLSEFCHLLYLSDLSKDLLTGCDVRL